MRSDSGDHHHDGATSSQVSRPADGVPDLLGSGVRCSPVTMWGCFVNHDSADPPWRGLWGCSKLADAVGGAPSRCGDCLGRLAWRFSKFMVGPCGRTRSASTTMAHASATTKNAVVAMRSVTGMWEAVSRRASRQWSSNQIPSSRSRQVLQSDGSSPCRAGSCRTGGRSGATYRPGPTARSPAPAFRSPTP
jgi:hypothetical protein